MAEISKGIFFLGIKHSGKSTFASLYAKEKGLPHVDSDDLVLQQIRPYTVREYYNIYGKQAFMQLEFECVNSYISGMTASNYVMSLGGGASDNVELMDLIRKNGKLVYLVRREQDVLRVIVETGIPSFLDKNNLEASFHELYSRRDAIYKKNSDAIVDLGPYRDKMETLKTLMEKLGEYGL